MKMFDVIRKHIESGKIYKIVFFGDSITSTEWVHPNWRDIIEYVVKEELTKLMGDWKLPSWNIRCINSGLDGSTSKDWLEKADDYILSYKPDLAISVFGGNDQTFKFSIKEHKVNLEKLFARLSDKIDEYYFCTTTPYNHKGMNDGYIPYLEAEKSLQLPNNVSIIDLFDQYLKLDLDRLFTFINETGNEDLGLKPGDVDFAHPNQLGNAYIAKVLLKDIFSVEFDPEKYMENTLVGKMYPLYK